MNYKSLTDESPKVEPTADDLLKVIQGALLCLSEGNAARAAQLLYNVLPQALRPLR